MNVTTSRFGTIYVNKNEIVRFDEGLFGFGKYHKYVILNTSKRNAPFRWLQSVENGDLAFVIIEPIYFMFKYNLDISYTDQQYLDLTSNEDAIIYTIVSIPSNNPRNMTANLKGPLIINTTNRKGRQVLSNNPNHCVRTRILDAIQYKCSMIHLRERR